MNDKFVIRGAQIVTMDETIGDLGTGDILVENGEILSVAASIDAHGAEVIDAGNMIALPGLIDAHTCLWQTVLRGCVPDLWLETYFTEFLPLRRSFRPEDNFNATYVGGMEMLSYGATTVVDYCTNVRGPEFANAAIKALKQTGLRHIFTYSFASDQPDEFPTWDARFADARRVYETFNDPAGLTQINFGIESIGAPQLAQQIKLSRELGARSSIHINEIGAITQLHDQNLLGPDLLAIHGNFITNLELDLMAQVKMPICFTPTADVAGKPADIVRRAMLRGIDVVFGCDIPCTVASDLLGQLRIMFNLQAFLDGAMERSFSTVIGGRPKRRADLPLLTPRDLIRIATMTTAKTFGLDHKVGSLTPGKRADIVLINKGPFGDSVVQDACAHVILQTSPRDIDTVFVDGDIRMKDGKLTNFDPAAAKNMLAASRGQILARST